MTCNGRVRAIAGRRRRLCVLLIFGLLLGAPAAASAQQDGFTPINPTKSHKTITLTGEDMSIQDVVDIARHGAKVRISRDHQNYMNRAYNLIIEATRRPPGPSRGAAALVALFGVLALLGAGCQDEEEKRRPGQEDVDTISASVAGIVFNCRSVKQGFLASADEEALRHDVDALARAAEDVDPDASFRLPESTLERRTTLRDQVELAARTLEDDCSPDDAERLRDAVGD